MTGTRSVAIVGHGATLWLAALALQRAFGRTGLAVTAVEMPARTNRREVQAALPDIARFHKLLRIEEHELISVADATFSLGQQFLGWSGEGSDYLHSYGGAGEPIAELPFLQFWIKARAAGLPAALDDFAASAAAARHDRIGLAGTRNATAHGYHVDTYAYERMLRRHAVAEGVKIVGDADPRAEIIGGRIVAIRLDGQTIEADLYVDASGSDALLIGALDPDGATIGPRASPCDRLLTATGPALDPLPLYGRIAAHRAGWIGLFPLARRTAVTMAYSQAFLSDDDAVGFAAGSSGLRDIADIAVASIADRTLARPWRGNCVAIGAAACDGDPIDAVSLQRDQIGITHLVALIPVDPACGIEADIYNDEVVDHYARMRDFQAAHYRLNARLGEPFWDAARVAPVSPDLAYKIALFAARGQSAQYNHETFNQDSWERTLIGHGALPRSYDPQVDAVPDATVIPELQRLLRGVKDAVGTMTTHEAARALALQP